MVEYCGLESVFFGKPLAINHPAAGGQPLPVPTQAVNMRISALHGFFAAQLAFCAIVVYMLQSSARSGHSKDHAANFTFVRQAVPVASTVECSHVHEAAPVQSDSSSSKPIINFPEPCSVSSNCSFSAVKYVQEDGLNLLLAYNVCITLGKDHRYSGLVFHASKNSAWMNTSVLRTNGDAGFYWGQLKQWKESVDVPIPAADDPSMIWHAELAALIRPPWAKHIGHYWDGVGAMWYMLLHSSRFPWLRELRQLVLWSTPRDELEYNTGMTNILRNQLNSKTTHGMSIDTLSDPLLREHGAVHCYRKAVIPGMMLTAQPQRVGGVFASVEDAQLMRNTVYRVLNISSPDHARSRPIRMVVLDRCPGTRCIVNHDAMLTAILESRVSAKLDFTEWVAEIGLADTFNASRAKFDLLSLREQVLVSRHADIVLGIHGSGMVNVVFMETNSVLIEIKPLAIIEPVFYAFAASSGQAYMYSFAMSTMNCERGPVPSLCLEDPLAFRTYTGSNSSLCNQLPKFCSFQLTPREIQVVVRNVFHATQEVLTRKRQH